MKTTKRPSVISCSFVGIQPINSMEEGIRQGRYSDHYSYITDKTVPLQQVRGAKTLYLVCFNRTVMGTDYVELLRAKRKQPCKNGPNYLLGLMAWMQEDKTPNALRNKNLVAAEPDNEFSIFAAPIDKRCFLYVDLRVAFTWLSLSAIPKECPKYWAFLAEDLVL